ncbi:hypothetical protein, unlikely [Trypanosoma brucei gambiense DAL972]|uniref:Uncharacterized protein n=1 Tax=Trypanosoma brucei gambiense (strain MHOM/CI/86/DAL972) TaxID=679716 RepID=C9ZRD0_TRYB9|nr:hypothetical protein, unlikely [Trypanosoma brucei gambiense DAL972]CBH11960.1 hypothetical protein, unlikely [Trypanosoma brucei gambiense DAL972]|eukprot:XP_011774245.1 hypothetical protein, unlikely [Trypanosoma brucei gambiense DAL972]
MHMFAFLCTTGPASMLFNINCCCRYWFYLFDHLHLLSFPPARGLLYISVSVGAVVGDKLLYLATGCLLSPHHNFIILYVNVSVLVVTVVGFAYLWLGLLLRINSAPRLSGNIWIINTYLGCLEASFCTLAWSVWPFVK